MITLGSGYRRYKNPVDAFTKNTEVGVTCWKWTAYTNVYGYGMFQHDKKRYLAHRFSFEFYKEKIPKGMVIDHLCRNRWCVNPKHMEVVTNSENVLRGQSFGAVNRRKKHCKWGHPLSGSNLALNKSGKNRGTGIMRRCKECSRIRQTKSWKNRKI